MIERRILLNGEWGMMGINKVSAPARKKRNKKNSTVADSTVAPRAYRGQSPRSLFHWQNPVFLLAVPVMLILSFVVYHVVAYADSADLNPTSCLGAWIHPQNAAGTPDVGDQSQGSNFNESNSAVLSADSAGELFCGGFVGKFSRESKPTKIVLSFSWIAKNTEDQIIVGTDFSSSSAAILDASGTSPQFQLISATSSSLADSTTSPDQSSIAASSTSDNQAATQSAGVDQSDQMASPVPALLNIDTTPTFSPAAPSPDTPQAPSSVQAPIEAPADNSNPVSSFFIISKAYAAEEDSTSSAVSVSSTATSTSTDNVNATSSPTLSGLLEVEYTLDGVHWHSLGTVDQAHLQYSTFEIPLIEDSTWGDISNIEIGVKNVPSIDETPSVYIDGLTLHVEYQPPSDNKFVSASGLYMDHVQSMTTSVDLQVRNNDKEQELVVAADQGLLGHVAVYDNTSRVLKMTTYVDGPSLVVQPEYFGPGMYNIILTDDPNTCSERDFNSCEAGSDFRGEGRFTVGTLNPDDTSDATTTEAVQTSDAAVSASSTSQ